MADELAPPFASGLIPLVKPSDAEDVSWALSTAEAMWARGDLNEGLKWVRRAAEAAAEAEDDMRALELAKSAAELANTLAKKTDNAATSPPIADPAAPAPIPGSGAPPSLVSAPPPVRPLVTGAPPIPPAASSGPPPVPPATPSSAARAPRPLAGAARSLAPTPAAPPVAYVGSAAAQSSVPPTSRGADHPDNQTTLSARELQDKLATARTGSGRRIDETKRAGEFVDWDTSPTQALTASEIEAHLKKQQAPSNQSPARVEVTSAPEDTLQGGDRLTEVGVSGATLPPVIRARTPSPAHHDPAIQTTQAVRVLVWRDANGIHIAPAGTVVSAITVEAILVGLDPTADLTAWLSQRDR